jgi:predicted RNase H-like HicB family nuclease
MFVLPTGTVREPSGTIGPMEFTAAITHEDAWYVARCLEVEVTSQGETVEGALANLKEALELYFEDEALPEDLEAPIIATLRLTA